MTGQELVKFAEAQIFRPTTMDSIINEFVPPADSFNLTNDFLPFRLVDSEVLMDMIEHGTFGKTYPVNLGAEHRRVGIPGFGFKQHTAGHWRESIEFNEEVLQRAMNPTSPNTRMGEQLVTTALNVLDLRLNVLIEYITSQIVLYGTYSEARHGVNYTYNPNIPAKWFKNVTSSPGWTSGGTWTSAANSKPITDIIEAVRWAKQRGMTFDYVMMTLKTALDFLNSAETQAKINASPQLVGMGPNTEQIFNILCNLPMRIDERFYAEETQFTAASAASDTTLDVQDASAFAATDQIMLRNTSGQEEEATIDSISGNTITISAGTTYAYAVGDRVTVYKRFLPDNYLVFHATNINGRAAANNWISTPSLIKANNWKNPIPGRYTWNYFSTKVPYFLEIGAGISGGPKVSAPGWMIVKTVA